MNKKTLHRLGSGLLEHKIWSTIFLAIILIGGFFGYKASAGDGNANQYVVSRVRLGNITQSVTGTGQVSASNQLDLQSQASGMVTSIKVNVGDHVNAGQLLATIDSKQALMNLENARIAYAKLTAPAKTADISSAKNNLNKSYSDAFNSMSAFYLHMPAVMDGLKDLYYGQNGYLADPRAILPSSIHREYRDPAMNSFDKTSARYLDLVKDYKTISRESATSTLNILLDRTYALAEDIADTLQKTQTAVNFISSTQTGYYSSLSASAAANVNSWSSTVNSDIASLASNKNSIESNIHNLSDLQTGADPLDIQSQRLALAEQEQNYQNYFIRAPFDGVVGRIPVSVYQQAGNSTVVATIIGDQKIANISLNEVDAAKVKTGNFVTFTFDAIDGFMATGTVSAVDLVGTVNQGIVTYNVKIALNTNDARILPGMSVNASIVTNELKNVLVVPSSAVKTQNNMSVVQILSAPTTTSTSTNFGSNGGQTVKSEKPPRTQTVKLGLSDDRNTQILAGLQAGDWVVTRTLSGTSAAQSTAPTILNTIGGNRRTNTPTFRGIGG